MVQAAVPGGLDAVTRPVRWVRVVLASIAVIAVLFAGGALSLLVRGASEPEGGTVDVGFAQDMSVHHRQAVLMAELAREQSTSPEIRLLAFDIETNQLEQIGQMQGWLSLWNAPALPSGRFMTWMPGESMPGMSGMAHSGESGTAGVAMMPGMASPADLDQLREAKGAQFDVLFLQLMLRHHQGGAPMAHYTAQHGEIAQVRNLADKMATSQGAESETMTQMLAQRGAQPLPPPR
ncbi:MAG TPA: DUF305 domain-containing protein [Pseudonocardiaceae bacterium]|nr:DUF305 domain-containing protein [Pseudonocardiaceae bacterium]